MTSEQVGTPDQYISVLLDLSFSKGTGIHSFIKYLFSIRSRADTEYTVVSGKKKKRQSLMELINLVGEERISTPTSNYKMLPAMRVEDMKTNLDRIQSCDIKDEYESS